jgi:hypothetical protein
MANCPRGSKKEKILVTKTQKQQRTTNLNQKICQVNTEVRLYL